MAKQRQKRARQHHVLPQFYLSGWADAANTVAMLRRDGEEVTTGTEVLGVEKDFYTVETPEGEKLSFVEEEFLRSWDGRGSRVLAKLLRDEFPLHEDDIVEFGLFIGLQWLRGRAARRVGQEFRDHMMKVLVRFGLDYDVLSEKLKEPGAPGPLPGSQGSDSSVEVPDLSGLSDELKAVLRDTNSYTFEAPQEELIKQMVEGVPDAAEHFIDADWHLLRLPEQSLFTSDEPISLHRQPTEQNLHLGLGPANAESITLPLSPNRCLLMEKRERSGAESIMDLPPAAAKFLNQSTVDGWWTQLFRPADGPAFPSDVQPLPERFVETP